jgi:hypothetical protein
MGVISRVGQNRIYTLYMTVSLVISLPEIPYIHRVYMVLANFSYQYWVCQCVFTRVLVQFLPIRLSVP